MQLSFIDLSEGGKQDRSQMIMISGQETVSKVYSAMDNSRIVDCFAQVITLMMFSFFFRKHMFDMLFTANFFFN